VRSSVVAGTRTDDGRIQDCVSGVARSDRLMWACRRAPEVGAARTLAGSTDN
jgi:hypothetical protein